jgi:hypothetical protein
MECQSGGRRISSPASCPIRLLALPMAPVGMAIDTEGNLLVADDTGGSSGK